MSNTLEMEFTTEGDSLVGRLVGPLPVLEEEDPYREQRQATTNPLFEQLVALRLVPLGALPFTTPAPSEFGEDGRCGCGCGETEFTAELVEYGAMCNEAAALYRRSSFNDWWGR